MSGGGKIHQTAGVETIQIHGFAHENVIFGGSGIERQFFVEACFEVGEFFSGKNSGQ